MAADASGGGTSLPRRPAGARTRGADRGSAALAEVLPRRADQRPLHRVSRGVLEYPRRLCGAVLVRARGVLRDRGVYLDAPAPSGRAHTLGRHARGGRARRRVRAARGVSLVPLWPQGPLLLARHARLRGDAARGGREHQGRGIVARAGRALGPARARHVHLRGQAAVLLRHPRHGARRHGAHARDRARPARLCAGRGARERGCRRGGGRRRPRHEAPRHGHLLVPHRARRHLLRAVLRVHRPRHHVRAGRVDPGPPAGDRGRRGHRARAVPRRLRADAGVRADARGAARPRRGRRHALRARPHARDLVSSERPHGADRGEAGGPRQAPGRDAARGRAASSSASAACRPWAGSTCAWMRARSSGSSARTARARPRSSTSSRAFTRPRRAPSDSRARPSSGSSRTRSAGAGWRGPSRSCSPSPGSARSTT